MSSKLKKKSEQRTTKTRRSMTRAEFVRAYEAHLREYLRGQATTYTDGELARQLKANQRAGNHALALEVWAMYDAILKRKPLKLRAKRKGVRHYSVR